MRYPKFLVGKRSWWNSTHHVAASSWISKNLTQTMLVSIWAVFCSKTIEILPWKTGWLVLELIIHRRFWTNHTSHIGSLSESRSSPIQVPWKLQFLIPWRNHPTKIQLPVEFPVKSPEIHPFQVPPPAEASATPLVLTWCHQPSGISKASPGTGIETGQRKPQVFL